MTSRHWTTGEIAEIWVVSWCFGEMAKSDGSCLLAMEVGGGGDIIATFHRCLS